MNKDELQALGDEITEQRNETVKPKQIVFRYKAKTPSGKVITDSFTAFSKQEVSSFLINEGYEVISIETSKLITLLYGSINAKPRKLKTKDLIFWLTQLSTYIKSGIPLTDSVKILANQMGKNDSQKRIYESLVYELTMGETFSNALAKQGSVFPALLINMLKAAEATGELVETLDDMAEYYDETEKTRKQIISAMTYPTIIMVFAIGIIGFIMLYVIPQFVSVYDSIGADINGLTATIINISTFLQENVIIILIIVFIVTFVLILLYKYILSIRRWMQIIGMRTPIFGKIIVYKEITIFTKTFASLLRNNVFITESIDILSKVTTNEIYKTIMYNTITNIAKGDKISLAFKDQWAVPQIAYYMIVTGESTGELAKMMGHVSSYFQELSRNAVNTLKAFIEPIMITGLAFVVGVIVLAVIVPMFDLYSTIQI